MPVPANSLIDLSFVTSIAKGSPEVILKYLHIFLEDTPPQIAALEKSVEANDWNGVGNISHALKSQLNFIGAKSTAQLAGAIKDASEKNIEQDSLPSRMKEFSEKYAQIHKELVETVNKLSGKL
ncbi:MAG: Hpt domain-containing protein [Chitinophagaceae bacterium]|nr:Hpt domain-containing protein [Chitinophagaceae bacterium]